MQGDVSKALNIPSKVKWGSLFSTTFATLSEEFMKPVIHIGNSQLQVHFGTIFILIYAFDFSKHLVEKLLTETSIEVNIITGQLDLIVATPGTVEWVNKVQWPGTSAFAAGRRKIIGVNNVLEGYYKKQNKFALYWINRAGHMVPADNPAAMDWILKRVTKYTEY